MMSEADSTFVAMQLAENSAYQGLQTYSYSEKEMLYVIQFLNCVIKICNSWTFTAKCLRRMDLSVCAGLKSTPGSPRSRLA